MTSVIDQAGYWRVVKVDLEDGTEFKNDELFATREEADASCEKCQKEWAKNAWDSREYASMEYQVRFVSAEEVAEEKRQELEKWRSFVREAYFKPLVPETFSLCCQKLVTALQRKVKKLSEGEISEMRQDEHRLFSPWQTYGGGAKLWCYLQLESGSQKVSLWGMFTKESLFGSICKRVEQFDSLDAFKTWLADTPQAASVFEKSMLDTLHSHMEA